MTRASTKTNLEEAQFFDESNRMRTVATNGTGMMLRIVLAFASSCLYLPVLVFGASRAGKLGHSSVAGHPGEIPVAEMGGRSYVEIEALARLANGSLSFNGNQIVLTLPPSNQNASTHAPASGFTKGVPQGGHRTDVGDQGVAKHADQRGPARIPDNEDWMTSFQRAGATQPQVGFAGRVNRIGQKCSSSCSQTNSTT